jgi:hypothetical protein
MLAGINISMALAEPPQIPSGLSITDCHHGKERAANEFFRARPFCCVVEGATSYYFWPNSIELGHSHRALYRSTQTTVFYLLLSSGRKSNKILGQRAGAHISM